MKKSWLREFARDLLALGSIPFYFLVMIRAVIGNYYVFVYQMLIAAIVIFILFFIIKNSNLHVARSLVAVLFTALFYKEIIYTIFAFFIWILLLFAAYYVKRNASSIFRGVVIGVLSYIISYYVSLLL